LCYFRIFGAVKKEFNFLVCNLFMKISKELSIKSFLFAFIAVVIGLSLLFWGAKVSDSRALSVGVVVPAWGLIAFLAFKFNFWKPTGIFLLFYTLWIGFLGPVPVIKIQESIRNLYFHVTMWFGMLLLLLASVIHSVRYLWTEDPLSDIKAAATAQAGMVFGILGLITGMLWAHFAWGAAWSNDPKQVYAAIGLLLYLGYFILRGALSDEIKRARISSVFNVFAFPSMIVLFYVLPRMVSSSLHPGAEGNPGLNSSDISNDMKLVFYPAIIGWTLLGAWIAQLSVRIHVLELKWINK
jgi:heme exporter protein C